MNTAATECERHAPPHFSGNYIVVRCAHFGTRFVVEFRTSLPDRHFMDYVEDLPDGDVLVQAGYVPVENSDDVWDYLHRCMMAGIPPDPELSE